MTNRLRLAIRGMLLLALPAAVAAGSAGCSSAPDDASASDEGEALTRSVSPNHLLDDNDILGDGTITGDEVQAVLEMSKGPLRTYVENGERAADIIAERCAANAVTPAYLLARIQGESGLVSHGAVSSAAHATGCACSDGHACALDEAGFAQQVECTAESMRDYFTDLDAKGKTVSGWGPNITKKTFDPCTVTPDNAGTAALYTYTPWVGAYGLGCGASSNGGSSGIAVLTKSYAAKFAQVIAAEAQ